MITEIAPAKINLYLHVGGVRKDGLHDLASLFVFTENGDRIIVREHDVLSLEISGPFARELDGFPVQENLVWLAATALCEYAEEKFGAAIELEKNLPVAAGIGGGSADAAAALRALIKLWRIQISDDELSTIAFALGADVPACLARAPVHVSGAGENITPGVSLPDLWVCLVNPLLPTLTGSIFKQFDTDNPSPNSPRLYLSQCRSVDKVAKMMAATKNDLEKPAVSQTPVIADVIRFLSDQPNAIAARMSGSGATCFALFSSAGEASAAAETAKSKGWWAMASKLAIG
ncbi:MAG: 4-(cytidine 5'-diphospho)-2-C-methyl-D-erythritol kinase [Marinicaulis sp.]|nr:4-(cytidine 5'-diphospho)-2-C-methyl-D-erythritol kinase [Marinicaulis sp.]NNL87639.1 4-(cytidine 5'-diphospho)-2-C-methyl-D-erythritol kinase [Marinicaulis sp.]